MQDLNEINICNYLEPEELKLIGSENKLDADTLSEKLSNIIVENIKENVKNIVYIPDGHVTISINNWIKKPSQLVIEGLGPLTCKLYLIMKLDIPVDFKECGASIVSEVDDSKCKVMNYKNVSFDKYEVTHTNLIKSTMEDCSFNKGIKLDKLQLRINNGTVNELGTLDITNSIANITGLVSEVGDKTLDCTGSDLVIFSSEGIMFNNASSAVILKDALIYKKEEPEENFNIMEKKYDVILKVNKGIKILDLNLDIEIESTSSQGGNPMTSIQKQIDYVWIIYIHRVHGYKHITCHRVGTTTKLEYMFAEA